MYDLSSVQISEENSITQAYFSPDFERINKIWNKATYCKFRL